MGLKNANSSPGVWLALLLVLVAHTLALTTHLDQVAADDFPKNEEHSENDSFLQGTTPRGGKDMPIILDKVKETVDDDKRTVTEGDSGKSINATDINSTNVSSDETIQKTTVDEIATTLKTTPARITLQELEPIPTTATINFEKHLTTSNGSETIEKTVEESEAESPSVRANETGDAIIEENRHEKIRDSGVKPLTSTTREFELYEENENFEEHTNSEFAEGTTTPSTKLVGVDRQKIVGDFHKNTERFDTEQDKRGAGSEDAISLANDTNVNYHKHLENGTRKTDGNDTNSDGEVNLEHAPKHEVEIFKNVTYPSILRFSEDSGDDSVADNTTPYYPTSRPKGRTISITGDNDLSLEEPKIVNHTDVNETTSDTVMRMFPKKSVSTEKPTELKPYPYIKSETKLSDDQLVTEIPKRTEESTEEISAFENTIGGKKSDEKIVVTEPESSVLVENSIQQFKPIHNKRSGNSSRVNSTFDAPVASTAWSLGTDGNLATKNEAEVTGEPVKIQVENGNRSQINNDVPQDHLSKSTTTVKSPQILSEVKENNIETIIGKTNGTNNETASTPVSKKLIDPDSEVSVRNVTRTTSGPGEGRVSNSTERTETVSNSFSTSNEIQSEHEDATSMVRNQFTVTEGSTGRANFSTSTEVFTNVPNATEKLSSDIETTVSLPVTISSTTISTKKSPSGMPVFQSTVTKSVDENVTNVTRIEKTSENHGSTRSFTEPIIGRTTTVSYKFIELTTTQMDSTVSQSDVTSSDGTNNVTNLINETSVATKSQESTTDGSIGQNATTLPMEVETSGTEKPAPSTIPNFETTENSSSEIEATTIVDQSNATDFPVSKNSSTEVYTYTSSKSPIATDFPVSKNSSTEVYTYTSSKSPIATDFPVSKNSSTEVYTYTSSKSPIDHSIHGRIDATTTGQSDDPEVVKKTTMVTDTEPAIEQTTTVSNIEVIVPFETTTLPTTTTTTQSTTEQTTSTSEPPDFSPSGDGVTLFVRMIIDGSWSDVCQVLKTLRQSLANLLTEYAERPVYPRNIVLYQPQCIVENVPSANLTPVLLYVVDDNGDFDYSMTEALPSLHRQSSIVFPLPILSVEKLVQENPTESDNHAIAVVAVSSVAFICLVLLAGLLFIMRKRQTRFNYGERCRPVSLDAFRVDSVSAYNSVRRKGLTRASKRSYGNPAFEDSSVTPTHPLNFAGLSSFCNDLTAITEEFSGIPQVTARMDELPAGAEVKNRYANVAPLPETRVLLQKINNEPLTEYINASYVRGPKNATKYYIACQAPMESTVSDFWRMIWEQQSKVIIMLTDIVENGVEKCVEYIPPSEVTDCHRLYGDYQVTLKKREAKEKYAISTLHLKNLENNTYREVYHIWYLWPTNGVPSNGTGLIAVLLEARALQRGAPGPIVTHCSPGTGRTGTLIALDLGIRQYEITRTVDVPRVVYTIRRDRAGAVQTKEQYAFIYKALNLYAAKLAGGALESM